MALAPSAGSALASPQRSVRSPLIPDIEIWRCAALTIKRYGDIADVDAAAKADALLAEGDREGRRVWLQIAKAIEEMQKPHSEGTKH